MDIRIVNTCNNNCKYCLEQDLRRQEKYIGFDDWAKNNGYEYATSHPLNAAHSAAADIVYNHVIDRLIDK